MEIEIQHKEIQEAMAEYILKYYGIDVKAEEIRIYTDEYATGYAPLKKNKKSC